MSYDRQKKGNYGIAVDLGTSMIGMALVDKKTGVILAEYGVDNPQKRYGADIAARIQYGSTKKGAADLQKQIIEALLYGMQELYYKYQDRNKQECKRLIERIEKEDPFDHQYLKNYEAEYKIPFSTTEGEQKSDMEMESIDRTEVIGALKKEERAVAITGLTGLEELYQGIQEIVIAGNTTMLYLLRGRKTDQLGRAPFTCTDIGVKKLNFGELFINRDVRKEWVNHIAVILLPCVNTFIGGDVLAGLSYLNFSEANKAGFFLDLGTNGEMALLDGQKVLATSVAAGSAFEASFCGRNKKGSALIDEIAIARCRNLIDIHGTFKKRYFETGIPLEGGGVLTQKHLRKIQLAKGAVIAGIQTLTEISQISLSNIKKVYLAGGFGFHLKISSAILLGMLPQGFGNKVQIVGNTSLLGACAYLGDQEQEREKKIELLRAKVKTLNLAEEEKFQQYYVKSMELKPMNETSLKNANL